MTMRGAPKGYNRATRLRRSVLGLGKPVSWLPPQDRVSRSEHWSTRRSHVTRPRTTRSTSNERRATGYSTLSSWQSTSNPNHYEFNLGAATSV